MVEFKEFDEFDRIWMSYRMFKGEAEVPRSGYYLCHIYPDPDEKFTYHEWDRDGYRREKYITPRDVRFESVLEHSAGVAHLVEDMATWFPKLFPDVDMARKLALKHDIGELYTGDIADDGRPEHDQKERDEQAVFLEWLMNTQPEDTWEDTYQFYLEFQDKSTPRGQALYAADKLEAILQLLNYERCGWYGDVSLKNPPTEQDLKSSEITGTFNPTDVWAYHFKTIVWDQLNPEITLPFICVLDSAVTDVRGEWFPWWTFWQIQRHPH